MKPVIAISSGCPCGIGPEIVAKAIKDERVLNICTPLVFGTLNSLPFKGGLGRVTTPSNSLLQKTGGQALKGGEPTCGKISLCAVNNAVNAILEHKADALVTAPINKSHWKAAGCNFLGHTEYLAHLTGTKSVAMMMASPRLKVSLVTTHLPLADVSRAITVEKIINVTRLTYLSLRASRSNPTQEIASLSAGGGPLATTQSWPNIAVCALNPHAGDNGALGYEEKEIIIPAITKLKAEGINISGPFSADTIFYRAWNGEFDAVIAMYHDQALIPVKTLDFKHTVNITLGLPFPRTSPDHGTAEDIVGKGIADCDNFICAIEAAVNLSVRAKSRTTI